MVPPDGTPPLTRPVQGFVQYWWSPVLVEPSIGGAETWQASLLVANVVT